MKKNKGMEVYKILGNEERSWNVVGIKFFWCWEKGNK